MIAIFLLLLLTVTTAALTPQQALSIGMRIWKNEASQKKELLAFWNAQEPFPSFGIGHFIWYTAGTTHPYTQQFPALCAYLQQHGITLPAWLIKALPTGAPWPTREAFIADRTRTNELRDLLANTIAFQTDFIINSLEQQWPVILKATPKKKKKRVEHTYQLLKSSPSGMYALIDYGNFKGTGLNPKERAHGQGWGLLQVLTHMPDNLTVQNAPKAFAISAAQLLLNRIHYDGPGYKLLSFFDGWMKRLHSYYR